MVPEHLDHHRGRTDVLVQCACGGTETCQGTVSLHHAHGRLWVFPAALPSTKHNSGVNSTPLTWRPQATLMDSVTWGTPRGLCQPLRDGDTSQLPGAAARLLILRQTAAWPSARISHLVNVRGIDGALVSPPNALTLENRPFHMDLTDKTTLEYWPGAGCYRFCRLECLGLLQ